jgi:GTPase Era involved in 16S rRNA processing
MDSTNSNDLQEMRIILLGRTGQGTRLKLILLLMRIFLIGKSALGNSIYGSQRKNTPFQSRISSSSVTQTPQVAYRTYDDRRLCIIDTPGFYDTNESNEGTMKQITIAFRQANPGPHAFLIVLFGRCTNEETDVLNLLKKKFGEYFLDYCFLIVTHEDEIREYDIQSSDEQILQKYFQGAPRILQEFRIRCSRRCFLINNRASFAEREEKISKLIQMIQENENIHANSFYNQEMFDHAERYDREWNNKEFYRKQKNVENNMEDFSESVMYIRG